MRDTTVAVTHSLQVKLTEIENIYLILEMVKLKHKKVIHSLSFFFLVKA